MQKRILPPPTLLLAVSENDNNDNIESKKDSKENTESDQEIITLDEINVSATKLKDEEKPFLKPGAVSTRHNVNENTQNIDQILRTMPGSYTQIDESQGTIQTNIRGLSGMGRVNTMIDGVPQTFYGMSADVLGGSGDGIHFGARIRGTEAFGAAIDQNLIADIDMQRGTFSGTSGSNGLMGSVNFRTIGIDDLIYKDRNFGAMIKLSYGSKGVGPSYMGALAGKYRFKNGGFIGGMVAYSGRHIKQEFGIGTHSLGASTPGVENAIKNMPEFIEQNPKTTLIKLESMINPEHFIATNIRIYDNYLAGRKINIGSYQLNYRYKPQSPFINTSVLLAYIDSKETYDCDKILI